jgi:hypothetical protein
MRNPPGRRRPRTGSTSDLARPAPARARSGRSLIDASTARRLSRYSRIHFPDSPDAGSVQAPFKIIAILLGVSALPLPVAGGYVFWRTLHPASAPASTIQASVGASSFTLPNGYFRAASRNGGRFERLDIAAFYPDFAPAGDLGDIVSATDLAERHDRLVFVTIRQADLTLDPADRPVKLYARFLDPNEWTHPGGLIARGFLAGSPFEGEELYFAAPEGREFAARCGQPDQHRTTPNFCIEDFRLDELNVELRFSANLLSEWEKLMAGARGLLQSARR